MRERLIKVEPFNFISVLKCDICKELNEHATANVEGFIAEELVDKYLELGISDTWTTVSVEDEEGNYEVVFSGLIKDFSITAEGRLNKLSLFLVSGTFSMDNIQKTRTFQDKNMTYKDVLNHVTSKYDGQFIMTIGEESKLNDLIVQYKETDWEFAKRLASHFNSCVIPESTLEGVKYYFGLPDLTESRNITAIDYSIRKNIEEYVNKTKNKVNDISETDAIYYIVESREVYKIWDNVIFNGKSLYIYKINSCLRGNELIHKYVLKSKNGFKIPRLYNMKMIGASLAANIIDVVKDLVKVCVKVDGSQDINTAKWFSYSTVYSSPDGTGWYCMPEKGDEVRVYFPSEKEKHAYVISAVHLEFNGGNAPDTVSNTVPRSNPNHKSIRTKYGKEVLFTPNTIEITNNKGMSISLIDGEGISITSNMAIKIKSEESINVASANDSVSILAKENIKLEQNNAKVELEDKIYITGNEVRIQ